MSRVVPLLLLLLSLVPTVAQGWNGTGHMVIAATAYRQLPAEIRARLVDILKHHPDYSRWSAEAPDPLPNDDEGLYLFMRASTWADEIRKPGSDPAVSNPRWHFIDIQLSKQGPGAIPANDDDILAAIAQNTTSFADAAESPAHRAVPLAWLIHLVGDIHQPLHCASMVDVAFPKGDWGANRLRVAHAPGGSSNLHAVWDGLLGGREGSLGDVVIAGRTLSKLPGLSLDDLSARLTAQSWAQDGARVAFEKAYLSGALVPANPDKPVTLPAGYLDDAQAAAKRNAALAGYRLAKLLERTAVAASTIAVPGVEPNEARHPSRSPIPFGPIAVAAVLAGALFVVFLYRRKAAVSGGEVVIDATAASVANDSLVTPRVTPRRVSCFISYSSEDEAFAKQLNYDLDARGFHCWFAPDDLHAGARIDPALMSEIEKHDKAILILSVHAIESAWVETEAAAVREREATSGATILVPIRIDSAVLTTKKPWAASIRRERNIGDFSAWEDDRQYQRALERLVQSLGENAGAGRKP